MKYLIWAVVLYFAWRWYLTSKAKAEQAKAKAEADADADAEALRSGSPDAARDPAAGSASGPASGPTAGPASGPAARSAAASPAGGVEKMVACAHCGIHLPLSEALTGADQRHYCCEEHRALHAAS